MESTDNALDRSLEGPLFRLLHDQSQFVIYARNDPNPHTDACPKYDKYEDQYFTIQAGTGNRKGLVIFISSVTRKVLYSRDSDPYVDQAGGGGIYDDNWFKLDPHPTNKKLFRLLTPSNNLVVYVKYGSAQTNSDRVLANCRAGEPDAWQWWSMLEDHTGVNSGTDEGKASSAA